MSSDEQAGRQERPVEARVGPYYNVEFHDHGEWCGQYTTQICGLAAVAEKATSFRSAMKRRGKSPDVRITVGLPFDGRVIATIDQAGEMQWALLPGDECPECGSALSLDEGEPWTRHHPGSPACCFCSECGGAYGLADTPNENSSAKPAE